MKFLIVVDMQNDFIDGSLGTPEAKAIVAKVEEKIKNFDGTVIFTRDTHFGDYLSTQEGKKLPIVHCVKNTDGWQVSEQLQKYVKTVVDKTTFGSLKLPGIIESYGTRVEEIELCGLCTDICVISNAMILKAAFTEAKIIVDSLCCAGVTPESHNNALRAMQAVQIEVI